LNDAVSGAIAIGAPSFTLPIVSTLLIHETPSFASISHALMRGVRGGIVGAAVGGSVGAYTMTKLYWNVLSRRALGFMCIPPLDTEKN